MRWDSPGITMGELRCIFENQDLFLDLIHQTIIEATIRAMEI